MAVVISQRLEILVKLLSWFGNCPLECDSKTREFNFIKFGRPFFICFVSVFLTSGLWLLFFLDCFVGIPWFKSISFSNKATEIIERIKRDESLSPGALCILLILMRLSYAIFPLFQIQRVAYGWIRCSPLKTLLNKWREFELEYQKVFTHQIGGPTKFENTKKARRFSTFKLLARYTAPTVVPMIAMVVWAQATTETSLGLKICKLLVIFLSLFSSITIELLEDAQAVELMKTVAKSYAMMQSGISQAVLGWNLNEESVKGWKKLVVEIRSQCKLMNEFFQERQLLLLAQCIFLLTHTIFSLSNLSLQEPENIPVVAITVTNALASYIRILVKATFAEKITTAEEELCKTVALVDSKGLDTATLSQLKFTHDVMTTQPTTVSFGKYMVLNRRIILTIINQVVTYLIVVTQFAQK